MKAREVTMRDLAQRAGADLFLRHQPAAAEALGVADHGVDAGLLDGGERAADSARSVASGFSISIGSLRCATADSTGSTCRCSSVETTTALTSGRASSSRKSVVTKSAPHLLAHDFAALGVHLGDADPVHLGVARGELAADQADAAGADDGEADLLGLLSSSRTA